MQQDPLAFISMIHSFSLSSFIPENAWPRMHLYIQFCLLGQKRPISCLFFFPLLGQTVCMCISPSLTRPLYPRKEKVRKGKGKRKYSLPLLHPLSKWHQLLLFSLPLALSFFPVTQIYPRCLLFVSLFTLSVSLIYFLLFSGKLSVCRPVVGSSVDTFTASVALLLVSRKGGKEEEKKERGPRRGVMRYTSFPRPGCVCFCAVSHCPNVTARLTGPLSHSATATTSPYTFFLEGQQLTEQSLSLSNSSFLWPPPFHKASVFLCVCLSMNVAHVTFTHSLELLESHKASNDPRTVYPMCAFCFFLSLNPRKSIWPEVFSLLF